MLEMVIFTITSRCNARCRMCNMWQRNDPDIPFDKVSEVLGAAAIKDSVMNLLLTGGEPSLRQDLPEIFDFSFRNLRKLKYASTFTNSLTPKLTQEAVGRTVAFQKSSGRTDVSFGVTLSLDGIGKTHDRVRGVDGAFGRVMENYLGLKALSLHHLFSVNFSCLVQRENIAEDGVFALLEAAEGAILPITFPIVYGKDIFLNRACDNAWSIAEEGLREKVVRFYERAVELSESGGLIVDNGAFYKHVLAQLKGAPRTLPCLFREMKACTIDSDGGVYLCDVTSDSFIGNIYEKSFDELWNSPEKAAAHAKMIRHCRDCYSSCVGSGRYQLLEVWQSGGVGGIAKLSFRELRKRTRRISKLVREYRYAVIPRL